MAVSAQTEAGLKDRVRQWFKPQKPKYSTAQMIKRMTVVGVVLWGTAAFINTRFIFGIDEQDPSIRCLDSKFFVIDKWNTEIKADEIFSFRAANVPQWTDGVIIAKYVRGVPGDRMVVNDEGAFINGHKVVDGLPLLKRLAKSVDDYARELVIPEGYYAFFGVNPTSYDSRYWGLVHESQIVGKTHAIF